MMCPRDLILIDKKFLVHEDAEQPEQDGSGADSKRREALHIEVQGQVKKPMEKFNRLVLISNLTCMDLSGNYVVRRAHTRDP